MAQLRVCTDQLEKAAGVEGVDSPDEMWNLGMKLNYTPYMSEREVVQLVEEYQGYANNKTKASGEDN